MNSFRIAFGDQEKFVRTIFPREGSNLCDESNFFVLSGIFMGQISMGHMLYVFVLSGITKAKKGKVRNLEIVSIFKKVF